MQDILRDLIMLTVWVGLLTFLIIPIWFICLCVGVVASKKRRAKFATQWPLYACFGVATFIILYAFDLFPPRHAIPYPETSPTNSIKTADVIDQADAIVEGSFQLDRTVSSSRAVFDDRFYRRLPVNTFVVPFQIDAAARGPSSGTVNIRLYFTLSPNTPFYQRLPLAEKLLLFLKRNDAPDDGTYRIINQQVDWLVLARPHATDAIPASPAAFVLDDAKAFLAACLDHPDLTAKITYMNQPTALGGASTLLSGSFSTLGYPQNDPARRNALRIGKDLGASDAEFLAIARKYGGAPQDLGQIARSVLADSGDYSGLEARVAAATNPPPPANPNGFRLIGDPSTDAPFELYQAILDSPDMGKMLPVVRQALASSNPKLREEAVMGLYHRQAKTNGEPHSPLRLPNAYAPLLASLLDDPDDKIQYDAMGSLFYFSDDIRKRVPDREINLPAIWLWQQHRDEYLAKAKAWWQKHQAEFDSGH